MPGFLTKQKEEITLWAENKTYGASPTGVESSLRSDAWSYNSTNPFEKWGGDDVGKDEPEEKASGWWVEGDARKGTAAGRTWEIKIGVPGGVLKWGIKLSVFTPLAADGTFGDIEGEKIWSCWNAGETLIHLVDTQKEVWGFSQGGYSMFLGKRRWWELSIQWKAVVGIEYPMEGCGGLELNSKSSYWNKIR